MILQGILNSLEGNKYGEKKKRTLALRRLGRTSGQMIETGLGKMTFKLLLGG